MVRLTILLAATAMATSAMACSCQRPETDATAVIEGHVVSRQTYVFGIPLPGGRLAGYLSGFLPVYGTATVKVDRQILGDDAPASIELSGRIGSDVSCLGPLPEYGQVTYFSRQSLKPGVGGFGYCSGLTTGTYEEYRARLQSPGSY